MHTTVFSGTILGVEGLIVEVEVDLSRGIPSFSIVGLPNTAVRESRERVTAAIKNSGFEFPLERITVNLAPADIKKEGAAFDLAIAMGIVVAAAQKKADHGTSFTHLKKIFFVGELALNGQVRPVRGVLPILLHAKALGFDAAVIPRANFAEALSVAGVDVFGVGRLGDGVALLQRRIPGSGIDVDDETGSVEEVLHRSADAPHVETQTAERDREEAPDMGEVVGQESAKRALLVAAAGGHHVLMIGPPGAGKTMLARRFPSLLPPLDEQAALETTMIYSITGQLDGRGLVRQSPFRAPHHSASDAGLIGGGNAPRPGEITLAHNGVLFLDELPEFKRHVLETLREPIEAGRITISRARNAVTFPARFQLIAAMNRCPCGNEGVRGQMCHCTPIQKERYVSRISGPLLDRISIHIFVKPVEVDAFTREPVRPANPLLLDGVIRARDLQRRRNGGGFSLNARLSERSLRRDCRLDDAGTSLLAQAHTKLRISARGRGHILRVARTIADLADDRDIRSAHVAEAIQYRMRNLSE